MESHLSSFSPFQNINIPAKNEMLSHEVNNHKPTEKMLISLTICPIKISIFPQTTLNEHERSFCDMLLCEYILVLLSIRPMGKPSFASSWIAHHVGREGHQDNLAPDNLAPGQFGTYIIKTDNLAPGQFGTNIIKRTIWHQEKK